jgi:hypothetical protein
MSDNENSLDIVIRTRAELGGAEAAEAQLDRNIGQARELGEEYAAQNGQDVSPARSPQPEPAISDIADGGPQLAGTQAAAADASSSPSAVADPQSEDFPALDLRGIDEQSGSIQAAAEKMRGALEQNGQATLALLNRTIDLIEEQNRKLGDMDRQLGQLAGRIKGLGNP